MKIHITTLKSH